MLYKPKYCCECGEKVERDGWKLWTNRRFCENCESEQQPAVWLPRLAAGAAIISALFGIGSFLPRGEKPLNVTTAQKLAAAVSPTPTLPPQKNPPALPAPATTAQNSALAAAAVSETKKSPANDLKSAQNPPLQASANSAEKQSAAAEAVYFCGARTKKGTPCSRRVKGGGRCWQHAGQNALLPSEKLLISR
jgi:hypothetical protein